jgi:hypothetical protein
MMKLFTSVPALALASAAALSLTAAPAMARHYHRDRGIDGGDVLAGILLIGGIAAIASAASNSGRDRDARDYRYDDRRYPNSPNPDARYEDRGYPGERYPQNRQHSDQDYRDWRDDQDRRGGYAAPSGEYPEGRADWRGAGDIDGAVNACVGEVERGNRRVDSVEAVNREPEGWRVDGRLRDGRTFSCTADGDGRIRRATVDGRAAF